MRSLISNSFVRFLLVGVINTLAGLSVIYALKWFYGVGDVPANLIGYAVGLNISFVLNGRWTFSFTGSMWSRILPFASVILVAYLMNLATVTAAIHWFGIDSYLAQAIGIAPYTLTTYLGSRLLVFTQAHSPRTAS
jgi:putative flippase GtrA